MNRIVAICLVSMLATPAFASKARINSLQGRLGLIDNQTLFDQPAYINHIAPNANFEFGSTAVTGNPKAEGGFVADQGGARFGAYLGHVSPFQSLYRTAGSFQGTDNPVDIFYGQGNWGANLAVSNSEDKTTETKQTSLIARGGMINGQNEFAVVVEALGTAEETNAAVKSEYETKTPTIGVNYLNRQDDMLVGASASFGTAEFTTGGTATKAGLTTVAASMNRFLTQDVYWGVGVDYADFKLGDKHRKVTSVPLSLGLEKEMTTWLIARASVQQNFLIGSVKDDITPVAEKKNLNDTTVAAGLGFKHNNFQIDGTLAAGGNGQFNGNQFLTQGSLTYNF